MSRAVRAFVPLNSRCSRKWLDPAMAGGSSREPAATQNPSATDREAGMRSVTTRRPEAYAVRWISSAPARATTRLVFRSVCGGGVAPLARRPALAEAAAVTATVAAASATVATPSAPVATLAARPGVAVLDSGTHRLELLGGRLGQLLALYRDRPQADPPGPVDLEDLDLHVVALPDHVLDARDALAAAEPRDVDQTVLARGEV